ncbi:MAG: TonB-dependent receptor, partial [Rikenellaceae bacterium]
MRIFFTLLLLTFVASATYANEINDQNRHATIHGNVVSSENDEPAQFASVYLQNNNRYACVTDINGEFKLKAPAGKHTLVVSFVGYREFQQEIDVKNGEDIDLNITLEVMPMDADEVVIVGESNSSKVNKLSFNVQAIAIDDLKNTTANLTDVLSKVNGVRIRETGGVGSEAKISLNGFSGSHVKIFIDGILQNGNSAFSLNNIPANFAERIEVYTGVVPIEFGSDALGGVINIVTKNHDKTGWDIDASYSYGSFNTHRSNFTFTHKLEKGFQYKINAYQNYSDNNYKIDNTVTIFNGSASYTPTDIYTVERFNDTYHNEAIIAELGYKGKKWADVLTLNLNYAQFYREVQTGTRQKVVYGGRHREGYSFIPTLQYSKRDFLTKGLSLKANANYSYGITHVVDTTVYSYNWFGDTQYKGSARTYVFRETKENSWNINANATYAISDAQSLALNYSVNSTA